GRLTGTVLVEVAVADRHCRSRDPAHDTVLIVDELDPVDCQIAVVQAYTCAIHVGHARARQGQVAHCRVFTLYDEESFSHTGLVSDDDTRTGAFDHEVVGVPHRAVEIFPRLDFDMITVLGDVGCCRRSLVDLIGPNLERSGRAGIRHRNSRQNQYSKLRFCHGHLCDPTVVNFVKHRLPWEVPG